MRASPSILVVVFGSILLASACSDDAGNNPNAFECEDGKDNDGDGMTDFPDDLGCTSSKDETEDSMPAPQCNDGRDNDGDGKMDFPNDPGCFAAQQDSEEDDCPDGPNCPQCADGIDNDMNGQTDFPNDSGGCSAASDTDEYTQNPAACGSNIMIKKLPFDGKATGTLMAGAPSGLQSPTCGGAGYEDVYELRITEPKVVVASTDNTLTTADTVLYLRGSDCQNNSTELACNDNAMTGGTASTLSVPISTPGTYYLVVDSRDAVGGMYDLTVQYFVGEGTACQGMNDCGPGLVCRIPKGQTTKVCSKHVCEDGMDEDGDGKNDYPDDPGCLSPDDDDEADACFPTVMTGCPECADGIDNDGDTLIDFGTSGDPTCSSASSASEACVSTDGVSPLIAASTMGTTVGATNDGKPSCATTGTHTAGDKMYRLDLPAMNQLVIDNVNSFSGAVALYDSTCAGTALSCASFTEKLTLTNLAAGTYYYLVDGYSTGEGAYTINVSGSIQNGQSCESALAQAGAITCSVGYACKGTVGSRTCQPALCSDGIDNDSPGDGKIDYPSDPGCDSPADDTEADPGTAPVCSNMVDDDMDGAIDYPTDFGCEAASGTTELFCTTEVDAPVAITGYLTTGTTVGASNDFQPTCGSSNAPEKSFALQLPVQVATLQIDTNDSGFDTILQVRNSACNATFACDDDTGTPTTQSLITMTGVAPGGYTIQVDGYSSGSGTFNLHVRGTVSAGTVCNSPLFSGGTNAVLQCPMGTTCTGSPTPRCQ